MVHLLFHVLWLPSRVLQSQDGIQHNTTHLHTIVEYETSYQNLKIMFIEQD